MNKNIDERIAQLLGHRYYVSDFTNSGRIECSDGSHRDFEPSKYDHHALWAAQELTARGFEVYMFFKQPDEINAAFRTVGWIFEIRRNHRVLARGMADTLSGAICCGFAQAGNALLEAQQ